MKKLIVAAVSLTVALVGFASLGIPSASANPTKVWVVNEHVASAVVGTTAWPANTCTPAVAATNAASLDAIQTASGGQVTNAATGAGNSCIIVQTDGSANPVTINPRGLAVGAQSAITSNFTTQEITPPAVAPFGTFVSGSTVTATQDSVSLDSIALTLVAGAHDMQLTVSKPTVQEGATACAITASQSSPTNGAATATYTDINGNSLVGFMPTFTSSAAATLLIGGTSPQVVTSMVSGTTTAAVDSYCGVAAGSASVNATSATTEIAGITGGTCNPAGPTDCLTRTAAITVTGVPATITLAAAPTAISCNGTATSTVTATVKDAAGNNVVDGTAVTFSVVALGTANPINTTTKDGVATSVVTPLSGNNAGTVVNVTAGSAAASLRIDCLPSLATATAAAAATATPVGGIVGPNTGTGGYLGQDSGSSFPMWALAALALGSLVLVGGGIAARRAGK